MDRREKGGRGTLEFAYVSTLRGKHYNRPTPQREEQTRSNEGEL